MADYMNQFSQLEEERKKVCEEIFQGAQEGKDKAPSASLVKLGDIDRKLRHLVEGNNLTQNFLKKKVADNVWRLMHNVVLGSRNEKGFEVEYVYDQPIKDGDFWEVRIDDLGEHFRSEQSYYDIGLGIKNMSNSTGKNREDYGFDAGIVSNYWKLVEFQMDDKRNRREWTDAVFINGDIIRYKVEGAKIICIRNSRYHSEFMFNNNQEYRMYIGMNCHFGKVTFSYNKAFGYEEAQSKFPKEDIRVFVSDMHEASPKYNYGVKEGGKHLLKDGHLIKDMKDNGMNLINYEPGYSSFAYDIKMGGDFHLGDALPERMIRNRFPFNGNMLTITHRQGRKDVYNVHIKSFNGDHEATFVGTDEEWQSNRRDFLGYGDKYVINLPEPNVNMTKVNDMFYAGTKCKELNNTIYNTLNTRMKHNDKTPAILLLGGDRSQTIGSMSGAFRAYQDLCCIYFDAQFNFRDPHMNGVYGITHGSPHFLLFQKNLRDAIKRWEESDESYRQAPEQQGKREAIKFFKNQTGGEKYWESLKDNEGYRGFNWLQQQNHKINHRRCAFVGVRDKEAKDVDTGKGLRSPLDTLFLEMLRLDNQLFTRNTVRDLGVPKTFQRIIKGFRDSFAQEYLDKKDQECGGKWIPPIMVTWDVDSIDPRDCPCVMRQEAHGLSSEECLSFADEIAATQKLVFWENVEFNPDLWEGYRDERVMWSINEFELGSYQRRPREATNKNQHRMDREASTHLIQDIIKRGVRLQKQ